MKKNVLKIIAFLKKDVVLTAALLSGILSSIVCKQPIKEIISSIDFKVLSLLFCLMTVIAAFKSINVLDVFSQKLLQKCGTIRSVYFVLCALVFFSSAIVTNDVALLTFVPITLIVCKQAKIAPLKLIVLETLAANLGSCITPMGNPQNLFIYSFYKMSNADFFSTTLKIGIFSFFLLIPFIFFDTRNSKSNNINISTKIGTSIIQKDFSIIIYTVLLIINLLSVFHIINSNISFIITFTAIIITNYRLLLKVDYSLLLTFAGFFIFTSNISSIAEVQNFLKNALNSSFNTFFASLGLSQIISNVPAALLLSNFTENSKILLAGVNVGGLGTIVASLASVISYKLYQKADIPLEKKEPFLKTFTIYNVIFLIILIFFCILFIL